MGRRGRGLYAGSIVAVVGGLIACESQVTTDDESQEPGLIDPRVATGVTDGRRLKPIVHVAEDGWTSFSGEWFDPELDARCTIQNVVGTDRVDEGAACVPYAGHVAYLDEGCTRPVVVALDAEPPVFAADRVLDRPCPDRGFSISGLYRSTSSIPVPSAPLYERGFAFGQLACNAASRLPFDGERLYGAEAVASWRDVLVTFDVERSPPAAGSNLQRQQYVATDGASQYLFPFDGALQTWCFGPERCVPRNTARADWGHFVDARCTEPAVAVACGQTVAVDSFGDTFFRIGEAVESGYLDQPGIGCALADSVPTRPPGTFHRRGEAIDEAQFSRLTRARMGEGRLQRIVSVDDGGALVYPGESFWDRDLSIECTVAPTADGATRCVPLYGARPGLFADAACATRAVRINQAAPPRYVRLEAPGVIEVAEVREPLVELFRREERGCVSIPEMGSDDGAFALSAPVPLELFARLEERVGTP
ncbi:MAG: hypothetical protein AAGA56_10410 [Myxococcota bacterium]